MMYYIFSFAFGLVLSAAFMAFRQIKLERRNAELTAQIRAEKAALESAGAALDMRFKATAQEALSESSERFLQLAQEKLKAAQADGLHDLDKRQKSIDELVKPVQKTLESLNQLATEAKGREESLGDEIKRLNQETARLVGALRDPSAQGQWGEFILEGLLEKSGLMKGLHYDTQVNMQTPEGRRQPDAVIYMQDGLNIVIDAKAPINEFTQRLSETLSAEETQDIMLNLAGNVKDRIKDLSKKGYWENIESIDFTVLFLPSEHLFSMALRADPSLIDFATDRNVIIASPTLLMSLIRVVGVSWRQVELAKNAQEISDRGADLYKRLLKFTGHIEKIGKSIAGAMRGYDEAVGSLERSVLPAARKFKNLQTLSSNEEIGEIAPIESAPRSLTLTSEDEDEKKRA